MLPRFLIPALVVLAVSPRLGAVDIKSLKPQGYLSDFSGVVDAESRAAIESYAAQVEKATGAQMSFVTLKTLDNEPLEDVSIDLFRQFGVGKKNQDNGVQLLLVTGDHRSRLEIGNALESVLPDGLDGQILVDMRPELQAGHYGQAILLAAQRIGQTIAQAKGVEIATPAVARAPQHPAHDQGIPWPLIIFLIFLVISIFGRRGGRGGGGGFWSGLLLGNLLGGGFGGGSGFGGGGGGFGGSNNGGGSSGGFGGFGGGDAGGGGASGSW